MIKVARYYEKKEDAFIDVPRNILEDKTLSLKAKCLYMIVSSLTDKGLCINER